MKDSMFGWIRGVALAFALVGPAAAKPIAWVQMVAGGAEARLVTPAPACPAILVDGAARPMRQRAGPTETYPNRVCAAALPAGVRRVVVEGMALPIPRARPRRLVILGDSGCRLAGLVVQHCNDPGGWPFARIAALAAAKRPDLVIHVGDYYYRETPCPTGDAACAGSPYGDRWATWQAEVFDPAAPLLAAAPWVFARGNHESCQRGAPGWFRLLDADPKPRTCPAQSDTFAVDVAGARLFIVDSMAGQDAVNAAQAFNAALSLTGVILTKADGDARGGAALSVRQVTGKPILFIGTGEKSDALELFQPERIASRILGMGDMLALVEQVQAQVDQEKADKLAKKIGSGKSFDLSDLRDQLTQIQRMGGMSALLDKLPAQMQANAAKAAGAINEKAIRRQIGIIDSMTRKERRRPEVIDGSRKRRIAMGAGVQLPEVNRLLKQFDQMQKTMKKLARGGMMKNMMRGLAGRMPPGFGP